MRVCPNCGKEQPDGTAFCGECGAKLEETESVEKAASSEEASNEATETDEAKSGNENEEESADTSADTSDAAEQVSAESDSASETVEESDASEVSQSTQSEGGETKRKGLSRNRLIGIIIAIVVVIVVVIIVLVVALGGNSGVPKETVEDDFKNTSYYKDGIVPSNYVNESDYELVDFSIDGQEDVSEPAYGSEYTYRKVSFSGTMENANFRTEFSGNVRYTKDNGSWVLAYPGFQINDGSESEALKGVDSFEEDPLKETCEGFESTPPDDENKNASTATGTVKYDYWYATDTVHKTQTFTFDPERGWVPDGEAELSNASTSWAALDGKTFELEENSGTGLMGQTFPTSSLTFIVNSDDEENVITAHYKILYDPPEADSSTDRFGSGTTYTKIDLEGNAISTNVKHSPGEDTFSFELQDAEGKNVTFDCKNGMDKTIQGDIKKHTMKVSFTTGEVYYTYRLVPANNETTHTLDLENTTYVEDVSS